MTEVPVWWDDAADGPTNMAADECLAAEAVRRESLVVRLYGWSSTTVSLGAFQEFAEARACAAISGLPIVRRPSGGGAIVHGTDITYAAAVPKGHPWGSVPQVLYDAFHGVMVDLLRLRGLEASSFANTTPYSGRDDPRVHSEPLLCFDRRAPGDVVVGGVASGVGRQDVKIMGSAQRRLDAAVLQHGSLLLRRNTDVKSSGSHVGLVECAGGNWSLGSDTKNLMAEWLRRVAAASGQSLVEQNEPFWANAGPSFAAARERFASDRWTFRR